MSSEQLVRRFADLNFEQFAQLAREPGLTKYERIGFPDSYREGFEQDIFADILTKLPALNDAKRTVLDIGPGCSDLPQYLLELCEQREHKLTLVDSKEMLDLLNLPKWVTQVPGMFPACASELKELEGKVDVIICYSVLHYAFVDTNLFRFLDTCLELLAPGGRLLLGDIPNVTMRKRFFASENGIRTHQEYTKSSELPEVLFNQIEQDKIDDSVVISLLERARLAGFHGYVMPQARSLPMANRREDILVERP